MSVSSTSICRGPRAPCLAARANGSDWPVRSAQA
jgi:hypothetical protein